MLSIKEKEKLKQIKMLLFKLCIINYMHGLSSMRRTIREAEVNMAYEYI